MNLKGIITGILIVLFVQLVQSQQRVAKILVFSKTQGFKHKSIPSGIKLMSDLAKQHKWQIHFSEDSNIFNSDSLKDYNVVVFLNTTGNILNDYQQNDFKKFIANGNGFVGIHAATDTEKDWPWYNEMIGATFTSHPKVQDATLKIDTSIQHPSITHLKESEVFNDEWYNFKNPVGRHINVLASLDESSYEGKRMNTENHPITWYHHYDGGRIFYTGLGHTNEAYEDERFKKIIIGAVQWASDVAPISRPLSDKWSNLFENDPYKNWDVFIGAPHATVKNLEHVDPDSNGKNAEALGLNNDPKNVFTFEKENGENVLHISGEIYGALTSKHEYENYHLKLQFKWGHQVWEPRLQRKRDSGILYHAYGPYRTFWNVWMSSQEFQVQEGDLGDYYGLSGTLIDIPSKMEEGEKEFTYVKNGHLNTFSSVQQVPPNHCNKGFDNEKPHGEWNTLELICFEGTSLYIVNGKVVMALFNSKYKNSSGDILPLTKGHIQIQSEGAEVFYKKVQIKSIKKLPQKFKKQI
ncbi:ThuA domain-containing protein [Gelidibacter salicanalis]|uniref:ThuA domain-containing protein n=1 Tax=Gelidibacter salicanalis TaxID=291193 RepID=A0A934KJA3_9FLAO|nr:ThuA domain-containing protein [Gelidibacter salicanalis]MBJ7880521.1 ThuA domain-containing protein [Gelidibacter salicanalis]